MKFKISVSFFFLSFISSAYNMDEKVDVEDPKDMLLFQGINEDNIELIKKALTKGANVNALDKNNETVLNCAVSRYKDFVYHERNRRNQEGITKILDIIKILIQAKANPNIPNQEGHTISMTLANLDFTDDLLEFLSKEEIVKNHNEMLFAGAEKNNIDIIKKALEKGADMNAINERGDTPLIRTAMRCSCHLARLKEKSNKQVILKLLEPIKILLEAKANPNIQNKEGNTILMRLTNFSFAHDLIEFLLKSGANPNIGNKIGQTALLSAIEYGRINIEEILLQSGADPNISYKNGSTPLMVAVVVATVRQETDPENIIVNLLLQANASLNTQNQKGETALTIAKKEKLTSIEELLKKEPEKRRLRRLQIKNNIMQATHLILDVANIIVEYLIPTEENEETCV